jgi:DNA replication protein DnaC
MPDSASKPIECGRCGDTGYIKWLLLDGEEPMEVAFDTSDTTIYAFNRQATVAYTECDCLKRRNHLNRMKALMGRANVPPVFQGVSFDTWDALSLAERVGKEQARLLCGHLATGRLETGHIGLVLSGGVGRGKTGLASCVIGARLTAGQSALWLKYNTFINLIRATYRPDAAESYDAVVTRFVDAEFLLLDDMGDMDANATISDDLRRNVYDVIGDRYDQLRPTLITTNLDADTFRKTFGARIADRIMQMNAWCDLSGPNLRF